jgi:hypothetical protein
MGNAKISKLHENQFSGSPVVSSMQTEREILTGSLEGDWGGGHSQQKCNSG